MLKEQSGRLHILLATLSLKLDTKQSCKQCCSLKKEIAMMMLYTSEPNLSAR